MRALRTLLSAVAIIVGALCIVAWAVSSLVVRSVEDGTAFTTIVSGVLDTPAVEQAISDQLQDGVRAQVERQGVDLAGAGLEGPMDEVIASAVRSDAFSAAVTDQVEAAHEQFVRDLTAPNRPLGPLLITFNASAVVNDRIDDVALLGALVPEVAIPPIQIEVMAAESFEDVRTSYSWIRFAAAWLLWVGLALVTLGLLVSPRRRWFLAKLSLAIGVFALGAWLVLTLVDPETVVGWLPGVAGGAAGDAVTDAITGESADVVATRLGWVGIAALAAAVLFAALARLVNRRDYRHDSRDDYRDQY